MSSVRTNYCTRKSQRLKPSWVMSCTSLTHRLTLKHWFPSGFIPHVETLGASTQPLHPAETSHPPAQPPRAVSSRHIRTHRGLAGGCSTHCLRGSSLHPAAYPSEGILPSFPCPKAQAPGLFRAVTPAVLLQRNTTGDQGRGNPPSTTPRGEWDLAGQAHVCIHAVFPLVRSLPEAVSFHHRGSNHTDHTGVAEPCRRTQGPLSAGPRPVTVVTGASSAWGRAQASQSQ